MYFLLLKSYILPFLSPLPPFPQPWPFAALANRQYPRPLRYIRYRRRLEIFLSQEIMTVIPLDTKVFLHKLH